jgi:hypothetical protein
MTTRIPVSRRRRLNQRGSELVELSLCFLGFMMLTFGTMDFVYNGVFTSNFCDTAAHDASRWASVHGSQFATNTGCTVGNGVADGCPFSYNDIVNYVKAEAIGLDPNTLTVTVACPNNIDASTSCNNYNPGEEINITVTYTGGPLTGIGLKGPLVVNGNAQTYISH